MRKRIDKPAADARTAPLFPADEAEPKPAKPAANGHTNGATVKFAQCEHCGLKQSMEIVKRAGGSCASCGVLVTGKVMTPPDDGPGGKDEVVVDEEGDARTQTEMAEKHGYKLPAKCETCGVNLTETALGNFHPCGHGAKAPPPEDSKPAPKAKAPPREPAVVNNVVERVSAGTLQSVTVTWGEEKQPTSVQYSSVSVGPFSMTATPKSGESFQDCADRLMRQLESFAEIARDRKRALFLAAVERAAGR